LQACGLSKRGSIRAMGQGSNALIAATCSRQKRAVNWWPRLIEEGTVLSEINHRKDGIEVAANLVNNFAERRRKRALGVGPGSVHHGAPLHRLGPLSKRDSNLQERKLEMTKQRFRPSEKLRRLGGWSGGTIGQLEALAGVNVQSDIERRALWDQFKNLFFGDTQTLVNAVADHCASIAIERMKRGELSLWSGVERRLRA
jgi:hypothetical protein